ncbi:MAG: hypothetical protein C4519_04710 [Desulfobacteraceae bacterium]|nr:MAG: hypothetical protein C4519_04710 [Desulfobacteraceae bacterium]
MRGAEVWAPFAAHFKGRLGAAQEKRPALFDHAALWAGEFAGRPQQALAALKGAAGARTSGCRTTGRVRAELPPAIPKVETVT